MLGSAFRFWYYFLRAHFGGLKKENQKKNISLEQTLKQVEQLCMTFPQSAVPDGRWGFLFASLGALLYT